MTCKCKEYQKLLKEVWAWYMRSDVKGSFSLAYIHGFGLLTAEEAVPIQDLWSKIKRIANQKEEGLTTDFEDFKNGECHTFSREDEQLGERECNIQVDDPGFDGTGYEHPAYDRGTQRMMKVAVERIGKILEDPEDTRIAISRLVWLWKQEVNLSET